MFLSIVLWIIAAIFWLGFFAIGEMLAIDTHFTAHPEQYPESFVVGPWQPSSSTSSAAPNLREATANLTFRRLRYVQEKTVSSTGTEQIETVGYYADVRWILTLCAILITAIVPGLIFRAARK